MFLSLLVTCVQITNGLVTLRILETLLGTLQLLKHWRQI
jgi:hypothetical protein